MRVIIGSAVCLAAALTVTSCSSSGGSSGSGASGDVSVSSCVRDPASHRGVVRGTVHNHSSKRSSYVVTVDVKANDSKLETGFATVLRVASGASTAFTIEATGPDIPTGTTVTCEVSHVARTASP